MVAQLLAHLDTLAVALENLTERIELALAPHANSSSCCARFPASRLTRLRS
jgi:hypothetical protein